MERFLTFSSASLLFLLLFLLPSLPAAQTLERRTLTLGEPFNDSYRSTLTTLKDATVNQDALQLTPDTRNNVSFLLNRSGRVLLPTPIKIWEDRPAAAASGGNSSNTTAQRLVISFNTSFHFNVYRDRNQTPGDGLAFVIVADGRSMPAGSEGGFLGLTNATIDGSAANQLVAVEFDTAKQPYDPDDNHVGIDVNSVESIANRSLSELNITISPETATVHTAWVDYSGSAKRIDVYVDGRGRPKPRAPALSAPLDLGAHLAQMSYFGFAGSTGVSFYELNCILGWNLTVDVLPERNNSRGGRGSFVKIGVPVLAAAAAAAAVAAALWYLRRRRRRGKKEEEKRLAGKLKSLPGTPREFGYKELKRATAGFDEKNRLGQGGFGVVYRGVIAGEGTPVAVKLFSRDTMQGDFLAELTIINRLRHKHLVRLLGWCHKNGKLLLVYDYMPNGSLDSHLYNPPPAGGKPLPWDRRCKVLAGVASALHYLHNEYDQKVVHRDLKASNILLDADFNARLGDFGLARAIDNERTSYAEVELDGVPGTVGYVAPECFHTGKATRESDVFGFGAVILEVVCGRRPRSDVAGFRFLADWVWKLHREGCLLDAVDPQLGGEYSAEEAQRLLLLGLACSHPIPGDRPKTQAVVQIISGSVPPPKVPPFRPAFVWPSVVEDDDGGSATSTTAASSTYASTAGWTPHYTSKDSPNDSFV